MEIFNTPNQIKITQYLRSVEYTGFYKSFDLVCTSIDQKCTYDTLNIVCDIIFHFINENKKTSFGYMEFFDYNYAKEKISHDTRIIGKAVLDGKTKREFDKFFLQIFEMLSYVEILKKTKLKKKNTYKVQNYEILSIIANDIDACLCFICNHIKFLIENDNEIALCIKNLVSYENEANKEKMKNSVENWIIKSSNGKHKKDVTHISHKILNPIFFIYQFKKYKASRKWQSIFPQVKEDLLYIRKHPRYMKKPFQMTQKEYASEMEKRPDNIDNVILTNNSISVKSLNTKLQEFRYWAITDDMKNTYKCEVSNKLILKPDVHHIWMKTEFDKEWKLSPHEMENLIVLDADYHRTIPTHLCKEYYKMTFQHVLPSQLNKILFLIKNGMDDYKIENFYKLVCYIIKKIYNEDFYKQPDNNNVNSRISAIVELISLYGNW